jgi:toxin ParE1/3/4
MKLRWSETARAELRSITRYISNCSPTGARTVNNAVREALSAALRYPEGFREGRITGTREIVAHPNYIVVYRIEGDVIVVLAVLHSRQQYP